MTKKDKPMASHQFWALVRYLDSPLGCDFRTNPATKETEWTCDGELTMTERWLRGHQLSVKANKRVLRELGGYCDCEVLFNVVERWEDDSDGYNEDLALAFGAGRDDAPKRSHRGKKGNGKP